MEQLFAFKHLYPSVIFNVGGYLGFLHISPLKQRLLSKHHINVIFLTAQKVFERERAMGM